LLLVDIDGVISLFGFDPAAPPPGRWLMVDGIAHLLSATAGEDLRRLAGVYDLAWCSGWEEKAEEYLPLALELAPGTPHLKFAGSPGRTRAHWKLEAIDAYAGRERPLAWIDDALDDGCRRWAHERPGPTLLVATDPAVGLTGANVDRLLAWAADLDTSSPGARRTG
jgi:hypothetical protein